MKVHRTTQQISDQAWEEALQQETLCQYLANRDMEQEYFTNYNTQSDELV